MFRENRQRIARWYSRGQARRRPRVGPAFVILWQIDQVRAAVGGDHDNPGGLDHARSGR